MVALTVLSALLYLVPIATLFVARARRDRPAWAYALDIPLAVAADLAFVLALARFTSLERATILSRVFWTIALAVGLARRHRLRSTGESFFSRDLWPGAWRVGVTAAVGVALSLYLSRDYAMWDRYWHFPLVSSMGAQRLPFENVFQPGFKLHYHLAGDVLAGELQALSFRAMHASLALSVAHDVLFGLTSASLALLFSCFGYRHALSTVLATLAVLLCGPIWFFRGGLGARYEGYSYLNFVEMSFRPHIVLAGLFFVGVVGAVAVSLDGTQQPRRASDTIPPLAASLVMLGITDETSMALLGAGVGAAWLIAPSVIHRKRWVGALALGGILGGVLLVNYLFSGSLAPGGPVQGMAWVPARAPGFYNEGPRLLSTSDGRLALAFDFAAVAILGAGFVAMLLRNTTRTRLAFVAFLGTIVAIALFLHTRIEFNKAPLESHRFMTAPTFVFPLAALLWLHRETKTGTAARAGLLVALALPALGTALWIQEWCPTNAPLRDHFGPQDFYTLDCRSETGARLGEALRPRYAGPSIVGLVTGCRPSFASGGEATYWGTLKTGGPYSGIQALTELDRDMLPGGASLHAMCPRPSDRADPVCAYAETHGRCHDEGTMVLGCELSAEDRRSILGAPSMGF